MAIYRSTLSTQKGSLLAALHLPFATAETCLQSWQHLVVGLVGYFSDTQKLDESPMGGQPLQLRPCLC